MRILKYELPLEEKVFSMELPTDGIVLTVQLQKILGLSKPVIWVQVKDETKISFRTFRIVVTGENFLNAQRYIGTFQMYGCIVGHLFEL